MATASERLDPRPYRMPLNVRVGGHGRDELGGRHGMQSLAQVVGGHHLQRAGHQSFAHLGDRDDVLQEVADLPHFGEVPQHGDKPRVLALRQLEIHDVVVEIGFATAGGDGQQLLPGCVHEHGTEIADFGSDVDAGHTGI